MSPDGTQVPQAELSPADATPPAEATAPVPATPPTEATPRAEATSATPPSWRAELRLGAGAAHAWLMRPRVRLTVVGVLLLVIGALVLTSSVWTLPLVIIGAMMVGTAWIGHRLEAASPSSGARRAPSWPSGRRSRRPSGRRRPR